MKKKTIVLVGAIILCEMAGIVGALFSTSAIPSWYNFLKKPLFSPPSWIFGPVWTVLYALMGISLFLIWSQKTYDTKTKKARIFFYIQLFLNALWSPIFFGLKSPLLGLIIILLLWISTLLTIISFYKISKTAGMLLLPYILWISFAAILNFSIWQLNP